MGFHQMIGTWHPEYSRHLSSLLPSNAHFLFSYEGRFSSPGFQNPGEGNMRGIMRCSAKFEKQNCTDKHLKIIIVCTNVYFVPRHCF